MGKITVINPTTEEVFGEVEETPDEEIENIVKKANEDRTWAYKSAEERAKIVSDLVGLLEENKEILASQMADEMGKAIKSGRHEVKISEKRVAAFCRQIPNFIADEIIDENENEKNIARFEPLGAALVISPWNAPIFVSLAGIIPSLLCGNNVVWKPSEYVPFTGKKLAELFLKIKDLPKNAFQIVISGKDVGKKLVEKDFAVVSLTGSVRAGKEVMKISSEKFRNVILELGGKDPAIVLEDASLEEAVKEIVKSATMYTGQVCFAVERVYCHENIYDKFVEKCVEEVKKIKVGNPLDENTDMGPFVAKFQFNKVLEHIKDAVYKGAKILYGGEKISDKGYFISPCILTNVTHSMLIMKEETFGPVIPIMKFSSIEEAIKLANDSEYGLTASIWTSDLEKGGQIAKQIEAGTVEINRHGMSKAGCPWGGYKNSGVSRIYSKESIRSLCNVKHIWVVKNKN